MKIVEEVEREILVEVDECEVGGQRHPQELKAIGFVDWSVAEGGLWTPELFPGYLC